jgi:7-cyano-7-deazaguanine synthase
MAKKCVVLLSGGLDSATCLLLAKQEGFEVFALSFDYQQRHKVELDYATNLGKLAASHKIITLENSGGSALTDSNIAVPKGDVDRKDIPITYVPARNMLFLAYAVGYAEVLRAEDIFIGVNALDYSGYPDCRPDFINSFQTTARLGTKAGNINIRTPLIDMTKVEIARLALELGLNLDDTISCYNPTPQPCDECDACLLRNRAINSL